MAENTETPILTPEQELEALRKQLREQNEIIEGQAEQLKVAEASAESGCTVVTYAKQQYKVLVQEFDLDGTILKAEDLKTNSAALEKLLKLKSGILVLVEDKK